MSTEKQKGAISIPTIVIIVIIILALIGFYFYKKLNQSKATNQVQNNNVSNTATSTNISGGTYTVEPLPTGSKIRKVPQPIPNLDRAITFTSIVPDAVRPALTHNILTLEGQLKADPLNVDNWLTLGLNRKMIEDYGGTAEAWNYAILLAPSNYVLYGDLADLYAYYLKDPAKAKGNFDKAISIAPQQVYLYFQAYNFYNNVLKDHQKALAIAQLGLKNNPNNIDLQQLVNKK